MARQNCWEFTHCGREPGGEREAELGVCPACTERKLDGLNQGTNGGRSCWAVAGTFCGGTVQGSEAQKQHNCWKCEFFQVVRKEEEKSAEGFSATMLGMMRVLQKHA